MDQHSFHSKDQELNISFDYTIIVPVYLNEDNIIDLLEALDSLINSLKGETEVILVVDGSPDHSYSLLAHNLPKYHYCAQLIALSRNFGSFSAIRQGLDVSRGRYTAVMAADLQEPPELILSFFVKLEAGECDIVFGSRTERDDGVFSRFRRPNT